MVSMGDVGVVVGAEGGVPMRRCSLGLCWIVLVRENKCGVSYGLLHSCLLVLQSEEKRVGTEIDPSSEGL